MSQATHDQTRSALVARGGRRPRLGLLVAALAGLLVRAAPAPEVNARKKHQAPDKCAKQRGQCETWIRGRCEDNTNPRACFNQQVICCDFLARCSFDKFVTCIKNAGG